MITGLDKSKRKVSLSIKELEIQNEKIAIKNMERAELAAVKA